MAVTYTIRNDLSHKQRHAALLLASGTAIGQTCRKVGINPSTLYKWRRNPKFERFLAEIIVNRERHATLALTALQQSAVDELQNLLASDDPKIKLAAIKEILGSKRELPTIPSASTTHPISVTALDNEILKVLTATANP